MLCDGTGPITEYDFVSSLPGRVDYDCRGPLVDQHLRSGRLQLLESSIGADGIAYLRRHARPGFPGPLFTLCAAHWMDLGHASANYAALHCDNDILAGAVYLIGSVCRKAGWDPKEISNLLGWQRVQLT